MSRAAVKAKKRPKSLDERTRATMRRLEEGARAAFEGCVCRCDGCGMAIMSDWDLCPACDCETATYLEGIE